MRQYGDVPPWLAANNTPIVSATTGLGTNGGAFVQTPDSGGFGEIFVSVDTDFGDMWKVSLTFPSAPPTLFIAGDDALGPITQATMDNVVTLTGASPAFPPGGSQGKYFRIHYEWNVSK